MGAAKNPPPPDPINAPAAQDRISTASNGEPVDTIVIEYLTYLGGDPRRDIPRRRAESTVEHYRDILGRADAELAAGLPYSTATEIERWINQDGRCPGTREHYRGILNGLFEWTVHPLQDLIDFNPISLIEPVRVPRRLKRRAPGDDRIRHILKASTEPFTLWFLLASHGGLRCCELAAVERGHITEDVIWIKGKGDDEREVPTHPAVWAAVEHRDGLLVLRPGGGPTSRQYVSFTGNRHLRHALGTAVTMHDLRRYFATEAYEATGRDIIAVQELLGHANVTTTQRYITTSAASMARGVAGLPDVV